MGDKFLILLLLIVDWSWILPLDGLLNSTAAIAAMVTAATQDTIIATIAPADKPEFLWLYIFKLLISSSESSIFVKLSELSESSRKLTIKFSFPNSENAPFKSSNFESGDLHCKVKSFSFSFNFITLHDTFLFFNYYNSNNFNFINYYH